MISLEHVGIAVDDPEAVSRLYETLLGVLPYKAETVEAQKVRTHFLPAGTAKIELLEALAPDSPISKYLEKRGEGIHHLAFEVDDVDDAMERVRDAGFDPLNDTPQPGADGKRIFFLHPKQTHGVLIELCSSAPAAWTPETVPYAYAGAENRRVDGHLAVYRAGRPSAPPLLMLHGAAGSTTLETAPLMRRLEPHFHVVAVDFTGHGRSSAPSPDTPFTPDLFADNARAALDHFDVASAPVFGFSMGGNMALHFARLHPDRVDRLAVHAANVDWNDDLVRAMNTRLNADLIEARRPEMAAALDAAHTDWKRLFATMRDFVKTLPAETEGMLDAADRLDVPTLVSAVDRDDLFPTDAPLTLHRRLPDARLALLPGDRHALSEAPLDVLAPLLRDHFLQA